MRLSRPTAMIIAHTTLAGTGVRTFIPYALPATFGIRPRFDWFYLSKTLPVSRQRSNIARVMTVETCANFLKCSAVRNNPHATRVLNQMRDPAIGQRFGDRDFDTLSVPARSAMVRAIFQNP